MGTTSQKLTYLNDTKLALKDMINNGLSTNQITDQTTFREYVEKCFDVFITSLAYPDVLFTTLPKVSASGTSLTLNGTVNSLMKIGLNPSELSQGANPSPTTPQDVHVIKGDNTIVIENKNLAKRNWAGDFVLAVNNTNKAKLEVKDNRSCVYYEANTGYGNYETMNLSLGTKFKANTQYTVSFDILKVDSDSRTLAIHYTDGTTTQSTAVSQLNTWEHQTITSTANKTIDYIQPYYTSGNTYIDVNTYQIEEGTSATSYVAHQEQDLPLNLPIENLLNMATLQPGYVTGTGATTTTSTNEEAYSNFIKVKPNTAYTFKIFQSSWSGFNTNNWIGIGEYTSNNTSDFVKRNTMTTATQNYYTFTTSATTEYVILSARGLVGATEVQFEIGSTVHPYVPYGQEIEYCKIGDYSDSLLKTTGKNLFNGKLELGIINGNTGQSQSNNNYIRCVDYIPVEELTDYKFSTNNSNITNILVYEYKDDFTYNLTTNKGINITSYLTTNQGTKYIRFRPNYQTTDTSIEFQVEKGTSASSYEPYGKNQWFIKKNIKRVMYNGTETPTSVSNNRFQIPLSQSAISGYSTTNFKCNMFKNVSASESTSTTDENVFTVSGGYIYFRVGDSTTTEQFTTLLSKNNARVYYVLATPTYILLNDTLQLQLNEIQKALSYDTQTNVSQINTDLGFVIDASAIEEYSA